jgi:arylsulfatase A
MKLDVMRNALSSVLIGFFGLVASFTVEAKDSALPLNFIVLLADDLGAKELGCYGNKEIKTPNLDRLAAEGTRFETCYATPLCSPTRVLLMTGQYGFRTGWFSLIGRPYSPQPSSPEYEIGKKVTFAKVLKTRGYATAMAGKWQLPGEHPNLIRECGFDEYRMWAYTHNVPKGEKHTGAFEDRKGTKTSRYWNPCIVENGKYLPTKPDDYGPDLFNDFVIDFVKRHKAEPFCVYYTSVLTHSPHVETPDPKNPGKRLSGGLKSNLEYLDHLVGKLGDTIDQLGLKERTVIIFVGDNGTGGDGKGTVTELGARVPFIVRCPGTVKNGVVSRGLTDVSDIFPTLTDFAGAKVPKNHTLDGKSLAPLLRGETTKHRDWIFSYLGPGKILRDERWLLELDDKRGKERFFDCGERHDGTGYKDVSDSNEKEVAQARERFEKLLEKLPGPEGHAGLIQPGQRIKGENGAVE